MIATVSRVSGRFGINPKEAERFLKFAVVGAIGFVVDFGIFNLLVAPFSALVAPGTSLHLWLTNLGLSSTFAASLGPTLAAIVSFVAAIISNFLWNRYWTYPDSRTKSKRKQFFMFFIVSMSGILIRVPVVTFLHGPLTNLAARFSIVAPYANRVGENLALAVAVVIVMFWNFFANRYWTYGDID